MNQTIITTHVLELSCGIRVVAQLHEATGQFTCEWDKPRPWPHALLKKVQAEYTPWRNGLLQDWCNRNGKTLLVVDYSRNKNIPLIHTHLRPATTVSTRESDLQGPEKA